MLLVGIILGLHSSDSNILYRVKKTKKILPGVYF